MQDSSIMTSSALFVTDSLSDKWPEPEDAAWVCDQAIMSMTPEEGAAELLQPPRPSKCG